MKLCTKCKHKKEESYFSVDRSTKDHLSCWCKVCKKKYLEDNKKERAKYRKKYYEDNKEEILVKHRNWNKK